MMLRVTGLFDDRDDADRVGKALTDAGFECVKVDRESTELSSDVEVSADDLVRLGLAGEEAGFFAESIRQGATLLVVSSDESRRDEIDEIMERFDLEEMESSKRPQRLRFRATSAPTSPEAIEKSEEDEVIDESGWHRGRRSRKEFQQADAERMVGEHDTGDATGLSRRAAKAGGTDEPVETPGALPDHFMRFEAACRRHYEDHYIDNEIPYGEYARGYHYGMVLAEDPNFRGRSWQDIEQYARRGWDSQIHGEWDDFRGAVYFGWRVIRGGERQPRLKL